MFDSWAKATVPTAEHSSSSSYTSRQRVSAASNAEAERDQRLRLKTMEEFASALAAIAAN